MTLREKGFAEHQINLFKLNLKTKADIESNFSGRNATGSFWFEFVGGDVFFVFA